MSASETGSRNVAAAETGSLTERFSWTKQARGRARAPALLALLVLGVGLAACGGHVPEGGDCPAAERAKTISGFCVPRWVSLKHGEVAARKGPGKDYPVMWIYDVDGLPVQIVAETQEWRRICAPDGSAAWVFRAEIDGRRTILSRASAPTPMRTAPAANAPMTGLLNPESLARLERCKAGWCQVKVGRVEGWLPTDNLWGVGDARQCH